MTNRHIYEADEPDPNDPAFRAPYVGYDEDTGDTPEFMSWESAIDWRDEGADEEDEEDEDDE